MRNLGVPSVWIAILGLVASAAIAAESDTSPAPAATSTTTAAATPTPASDAARPRVCLVTVIGPLGIPVSRVNGFVLGHGKFVVAELGAAAQPGVTSLSLQFPSGATSNVKEFAWADPSLGLVLLAVDPAKQESGGLELSAAATPTDTASAMLFGWKSARIRRSSRSGRAAPSYRISSPTPSAPSRRSRRWSSWNCRTGRTS